MIQKYIYECGFFFFQSSLIPNFVRFFLIVDSDDDEKKMRIFGKKCKMRIWKKKKNFLGLRRI